MIVLIIAGGCYNTFDYTNYKHIYEGVYSAESMEKGFSLLQKLSNSLGFTYEGFRFLIIFFSILCIAATTYRLIGKYLMFFELFYFFTPLSFDIANIRNMIANAIFYMVFLSSIKLRKNKVTDYIFYVLSILILALFHRSIFVYIIFIYALSQSNKENFNAKRKNYTFMIVLVVIFTCILVLSRSICEGVLQTLLYVVNNIINLPESKLLYFDIKGRYGYILYSICHLSFLITIAYVRKLLYKYRPIMNNNYKFLYTKRLIDAVYLCNILLILFLILVRVNSEFYRIFRGVQGLEYVCFFATIRYIPKGKERIIAYTMIIISVIINFIILIYPYIYDIFFTLFTDNFFLDYLFY